MPLVYAAIEPVKGMQKATNFTSVSGELPIVVDLAHKTLIPSGAFKEFFQDLVLREPGLTAGISYPIRIYCLEVEEQDQKMILEKLAERFNMLKEDGDRRIRRIMKGELNLPPSVFPNHDREGPYYRDDYLVSFSLKASNVRIVGCFEYIPWDKKLHTLIINSQYTDQKAIQSFSHSVACAFSFEKAVKSEFIDTGIQALKPAPQAIIQVLDDKAIVADSKSNAVFLEQPQQPAPTLVDNKAVVTTTMAKTSPVVDSSLTSEPTQPKDTRFKSKMALVAGCTLAGYETFGLYGAAAGLIASVVAIQQIGESTQPTVVKKK